MSKVRLSVEILVRWERLAFLRYAGSARPSLLSAALLAQASACSFPSTPWWTFGTVWHPLLRVDCSYMPAPKRVTMGTQVFLLRFGYSSTTPSDPIYSICIDLECTFLLFFFVHIPLSISFVHTLWRNGDEIGRPHYYDRTPRLRGGLSNEDRTRAYL